MLGENIKNSMKKNGLSINKLSKLSNIGYATLHDIIFHKTVNPRIDTISKIATALNEPVNELIEGGGQGEESYIEN